MSSGFGAKAIGAIVRASGWSESWGIAPSASLTFFAALPVLCASNPASVPNEDAVREAFVELGYVERGNELWQEFIEELARRAERSMLTVNDVARAAWTREERRIRDVFDGLRLSVATIDPLLRGALGGMITDEPPPIIENGPAQYEIVIRGEHGDDASNRYATFEDARYVLAHLSAKLFGGVRPAVPTGNPIIITVRGRIGAPRSAWIRELRAASTETLGGAE